MQNDGHLQDMDDLESREPLSMPSVKYGSSGTSKVSALSTGTRHLARADPQEVPKQLRRSSRIRSRIEKGEKELAAVATCHVQPRTRGRPPKKGRGRPRKDQRPASISAAISFTINFDEPGEGICLQQAAKSSAQIRRLWRRRKFENVDDDVDGDGGAWADDDYLVGDDGELELDEGEEVGSVGGDEEGGWDDNADGDEEVVLNAAAPPSTEWPNVSRLAGDHVAAGSFESAIKLLKDQIGVVSPGPFKDIFLRIYASSRLSHRGWGGLGAAGPVYSYPIRNWQEEKNHLPAAAMKLSFLARRLQQAYQLTTHGKFGEAVLKLRNVLLSVPLLVVHSKQEQAEAEQLVAITREYLAALLLESARKELPKTSPGDMKRNAELAAYFTHFDLQPMHKILALRSAINTFFKIKQMRTCASLCKRLLELAPKPEVAAQIRKVLAEAEKDNTDAHTLAYDEHNPFVVCSRRHVPLYRRPQCKCSFCGASFSEGLKGTVCDVCQVSEIGKNVVGLRISTLQK